MRIRYLPSTRTVPLGVVVWHPAMIFALGQIDRGFRKVTGKEAILTGGQEEAHSLGSLHYGTKDDFQCRAADFADDGITADQKKFLTIDLQSRLGHDFDIVWEANHLHVEFDPD